MNGATMLPGGAAAALIALLQARTGQVIDGTRTWRIGTALKPVLSEAGLPDHDALVAALGQPGSARLEERVIDALLNQETSFFRDGLVLETVATAIEALEAADPLHPVRIWSVGCSGGQEIYSLAMTLLDRGSFRFANLPFMMASDVSAAAVARARRGSFTQFEVQRGLPARTLLRWFEQKGDEWLLRPELVRRVVVRQHNIVDDPMPPGDFDIVLCRNVLLYLSPELRGRVLDRLARAMRPNAMLVLGAGETVLGLSDAFSACRTYRGLYRRTGSQSSFRLAG